MMLGIPVLQVYGLTETTAICTMDDPDAPVIPGRSGPAISGVEMKIAENAEILVRGPNIFSGILGSSGGDSEGAAGNGAGFILAIRAKWTRTGNWKIVGRIKNPDYSLGSGHNNCARAD